MHARAQGVLASAKVQVPPKATKHFFSTGRNMKSFYINMGI